MKIDSEYMTEYIKKIMKTDSPAGDTGEAISEVKKEFEKFGLKCTETNKGAVIATVKGKNDNVHKIISAHIDTLGLMVKEIKSNGRLKLNQLGGFSWPSVEGENVRIKTSEGKIYTGTVLPDMASVHIFGDIPRTAVRTEENMEVRLDENVSNADEVKKLGIEVGDFVSAETRTIVTENGYIKSRYLDDKAAVAIVMGICRYIKENSIIPAYTTHFYISNYEEVGHGVSVITDQTDEFIAIDIGTVGKGQNSTEFAVSIASRDAFGPYDFRFRKKLTDICQKNNIDYRVDMYNRYGSDASKVAQTGKDVKYALVGPGVDATHHYERTHIKSLENTAKLLIKYIEG